MQIRVSDEGFQYKEGSQRASHISLQHGITRVTPPGWMDTAGEKECPCRRITTEYARAGGRIQHSQGTAQLSATWHWLLLKVTFKSNSYIPHARSVPQRFYSKSLPTFGIWWILFNHFHSCYSIANSLIYTVFPLFFSSCFILVLQPFL